MLEGGTNNEEEQLRFGGGRRSTQRRSEVERAAPIPVGLACRK